MKFVSGDLVVRKYSGHISLDSEIEWMRTTWYENDVGVVLASGFKHHAWKTDLVKVLLPTGIAYIEAQNIIEVKL